MTITISRWQSPPQNLQLSAGQVDLWRYSLDTDFENDRALGKDLSADEISRADKLKIPEKRRQFIVARAGLRKILASYLKVRAAEITFSYDEKGKPALAENISRLDFNLSHSGTLALLAVSQSGAVGVDVENIDDTADFYPVAERYLNQQELAELAAVQGRRQRRTFYRLWTRKESLLKMLGVGLSVGPENISSTSETPTRSVYISRHSLAAITASFEITSINRYQLAEIKP